jgi:hypothetical protein
LPARHSLRAIADAVKENTWKKGSRPMTRSDRTGANNDPLHGALSSVSAARKSARRRATGEACPFQRMQRAIRKAERRACEIDGDVGGTGATILRFRSAPLARLVERRRVGGEEVRAADDIAMAFHAQAAAVMIKSPSLEKRDASYQGREPFRIIDAVSRYKPWASHWSRRARLGDRMLEIVVAAIIDERPFHVIEADAGIRHGLAVRTTIAGLRDYAARAGWTDRSTGDAWIREAEAMFTLRKCAEI